MLRGLSSGILMLAMSAGAAMAQDAERPDIPVIWGDDVEMWNDLALSPGHAMLRNPEYRPHRR